MNKLPSCEGYYPCFSEVGKSFYLIAVGMFYHAYGYGAFALSRATGYRVLQRIRETGGVVEQMGEKIFLFRGLDGTPDESMIAEQKPQTVTSPTKDVPQSEASFSWLPPYQIGYSCSV